MDASSDGGRRLCHILYRDRPLLIDLLLWVLSIVFILYPPPQNAPAVRLGLNARGGYHAEVLEDEGGSASAWFRSTRSVKKWMPRA